MSKANIENTTKDFDLIVIGAGAAGLSVAAGAVQLGYKTALIERGKMGGDCLNTGCVPSKALLAAAKAAYNVGNATRFGIKTSAAEIDFAAVKDHVQNAVKAIEPNDSVERFQGFGVNVIEGTAKFIDTNTIDVEGRKLSARYIVITAGSSPAIPNIKGLEHGRVLTNETIFDLHERPEHLIIIGGGPIGMEMAQAHARLGVEVTVLSQSRILSKDDKGLTAVLRDKIVAEGVRIEENITIEHVQHGNEKTSVTFSRDSTAQTIHGSHILVAAGRSASVQNLDLEKADIDHDKNGIHTDERLRTSQRHIFAAGDIVTGAPQFTHIAGYHAGIIIKNMMFKIPVKVDYRALPWVTYTDPELAHVGMTEDMARAQHENTIKTLTWDFADNDRAIAELSTTGKIKVITDKRGRILGASIIGPQAGELISLWGLAISRKMKIGAVANMIVPYPTMSEISKRAASSYYTPSLFSDKTRRLVGWLKKLPL